MKVVIIVQARMGSKRLPGKVLMPALGQPMLAHQLNRLRQVKLAQQIVIATSANSNDDPIADYCLKNFVAIYRGSEDDVLARFSGAARAFSADIVVRITADCPLIDPLIIDSVIDRYLTVNSSDAYLTNTLERTFPRGMDTEVFSSKLLYEADRMATAFGDREHVTPYLIRNDSGAIQQINVRCENNLSALRFTLDYPKDYMQICGLLATIGEDYSMTNLVSQAHRFGLDWHDNSEQSNTNINTNININTSSVNIFNRFGLGTAQLGMFYGKFNRDGVPSVGAAKLLLEVAKARGLACVDTASSYGKAETVLGQCGSILDSFSVVTKTPRFPDGLLRPEHARILRQTFFDSLTAMHIKKVDGLLIHHGPNLIQPGASYLYDELLRLKQEGFVEKIGISSYTGDLVEEIHDKYALDLVQLPINLLDHRLTESDSLRRIAKSGIEIHARSVFLQGLLLANPRELGNHFEPIRAILQEFHSRCQAASILPAHAALCYLTRIPEVTRIIIGVESVSQFHDIFDHFPESIDIDLDDFAVHHVDILNPVLWVN